MEKRLLFEIDIKDGYGERECSVTLLKRGGMDNRTADGMDGEYHFAAIEIEGMFEDSGGVRELIFARGVRIVLKESVEIEKLVFSDGQEWYLDSDNSEIIGYR